METTYLIQKVEVSAQYLDQNVKSEIPNNWVNEEFCWETLNDVASRTVDMIKNAYVKDFFKKLVVTITYSIKGGDDVKYCIDCGYDEEGTIYCS